MVAEGTGRFIVGGNWKCNGTKDSVAALVKSLNAGKEWKRRGRRKRGGNWGRGAVRGVGAGGVGGGAGLTFSHAHTPHASFLSHTHTHRPSHRKSKGRKKNEMDAAARLSYLFFFFFSAGSVVVTDFFFSPWAFVRGGTRGP